MYQSSSSPIFPNRAADLARKNAASDARIAGELQRSREGRLRLFNTLISPEQVVQTFGPGAGVDAARLQSDSEVARATGILSKGLTGLAENPESMAIDVFSNAPEVVPLNRVPAACFRDGSGHLVRTHSADTRRLASVDSLPSMPQMAPTVVRTADGGEMMFRGGLPTDGSVQAGLTGFAPTWGDSWGVDQPFDGSDGGGFLGWITDHPWLSLAAAGLGAWALARRGR